VTARPLAASALLLLAACADGRAGVAGSVPVPARPASCQEVPAGADLAAAVAAAPADGALCLGPGDHVGPLRVDRRLTIWGPRSAVVRAGAPGSVVVVTAPGARLAGLTVDGTGGRIDKLDAAVHVTADDVTVEGVAVVRAVYGILVEKARRVTVRGNHVRGDASTSPGLRGDTIRLWETDDSLIADNLVEDGRDLVVWYARRNRIERNRVLRGRYGTHFMFSHDNVVEDNRYLHGVVGVFVMYSRGVTLRRNLIAGASGAAGLAIGLKDSGNIVIEANVLLRDTVGLYVDQSPGVAGDTLAILGNVFRQCETAVSFHTTPARTRFAGNDFADNRETVRSDAGVDPSAADWAGNYFDDYVGYDLDGDGIGDLPHEARSASEQMIARHPPLAFFRGGPVLEVVDAASKLMPLWTPQTLLVDEAPRMRPLDPQEVLHAR
jgi:nitrous oxidase accessory protein